MTLDRSFIEKIQELCPANEHEILGLAYSDKKLHLIEPPLIDTVTVHTLTAVEEFCRKELAGSEGHYIILVESPGRVMIMGDADVSYRNREQPLRAELQASPFPFGKFLPVELFIIALQSQFVQDATTAAMLALVGNLTTTSESKTLDDGVSQSVEARVGLSKLQNVVVPNPVQLAPYRTFIEIEQPLSDHTCALFEADGGAWKNVATSRIKDRLENTLADLVYRDIFTVLA